MFNLDKHEAEFSHLNFRKENHGDEKVPAATLTFKSTVSALVLDTIDKKLRKTFFEKPGKGAQQALPIDGNTLTALALPYLKEQKLGLSYDGYEIEIAGLLDHMEPLFFADVELKIEKVTFIEGGSAELLLKANTVVDREDYAPLLSYWAQGDVRVTLTPPDSAASTGDGPASDEDDGAAAQAEADRLVAAGKQAA